MKDKNPYRHVVSTVLEKCPECCRLELMQKLAKTAKEKAQYQRLIAAHLAGAQAAMTAARELEVRA